MDKVFLYCLLASLNPTLLTATTVMLLLPNPRRLLLGYLLGAFTAGMTSGLVIVTWLGSSSGATGTMEHTANPWISIMLGSVAILVAFVIRSGRWERRRSRREQTRGPKETPKWQLKLSQGSTRTTFVVGLLLSFPGASYLAALVNIHKQGLDGIELVLTLVVCQLILLVLLELPVIGFFVAPEWTPLAVERFKAWIAPRALRAVEIGAFVIGVALLLQGVLTLVSPSI